MLAPPTPSRRAAVLLAGACAVSIALFVLGGVLLYRHSLHKPGVIPGIVLGGRVLDGDGDEELAAAIARATAVLQGKKILFTFDKHRIAVPLQRLGATVDAAATRQQLAGLGKSGDLANDLLQRIRARRGKLHAPLVLALDPERARAFFAGLKRRVDRPPVAPRLDLERRTVLPGRNGYQLRLYDALAATEVALRAGRTEVALPVTVVRPKGKGRHANLDISHALARFSTVYMQTTKYKDRTYNLKLGASKIDGFVLGAGETFSYNKVVGPRDKAQGFRTAPVISQGELVDGMAGGACQLSSTLFAAAFFAGLDLESSRPHTMPSHYIKMGLDATVAYPTTDLVLKNPYPFPVAFHMKVSQGRVKVAILGKKRPWRRIVFKRTIKQRKEFKEVVRPDPTVPRGVRIISQVGAPGFKLVRQRLFFGKGPKPVKTEQRELSYPPTTQYVRLGTGKPDPDFKPPRPHAPFGDAKEELTIAQ